MEDRFCKGIRLLGLGFPIVFYEKEKVSQICMGKAMYHHSCLFSTSKQAHAGRLDPTAERNEARMLSCATTFCPNCGCTGCVPCKHTHDVY